MFKRFCIFLCFLLLLPFPVAASDAPEISAASAVVMDCATRSVLYEKDAKRERPMASTTKIMTCLLACESGKMNEVVTVTQEMLRGVEGSALYLKAGDTVTLSDLVKGAMLASGNDAANAIAVYLGKTISGFVERMNEKAKQIGLTATLFVTPSGLDAGKHHSTAYDMALLAAEALQNEAFCVIAKMPSAQISISGKTQTVYNHNKLLNIDGFIGIKTGFTKKAGRCLVSAYDNKGSKIICVTLSAPDDWEDHQKLVDFAKTRYQSVKKKESVSIAVVGGRADSVRCTYEYAAEVMGNTNVKLYYYPFLYAPVRTGELVGKAEIYSGDMLMMTVGLTVAEGIELWQTKTK